MMMAQLHLHDIANKEELHDRLAQLLELPEYYGRNLDALYDVLTDRGEQTILWVYPDEAADTRLGGYLSALLDTLQDASAENPAVSICIMEQEENA